MNCVHAPEGSNSHQFTVKVVAEDIDILNHVNNMVYLKWINEASEKHWSALTNETIDSKYFWVCIRHEIDYVGEAFLDEKITVCTWVGASKGVRSIRHVAIYKEDTLLAKALTTWCLVDIKTQKPTRVRQDVLDLLTQK
jgi:acyl-CoA thioester hydrolase